MPGRIAELQHLAQQAARTAAAAPVHASLDLAHDCLDDFFAVYTADDRITDARHLDSWRRSLQTALMTLRPTRRADGTVTIDARDILRFQGYLHRNDVGVTDQDRHRRAVAFLRALPHVARQ